MRLRANVLRTMFCCVGAPPTPFPTHHPRLGIPFLRSAKCYEVPVQYVGECGVDGSGGALLPPPSGEEPTSSCEDDKAGPVCSMDNVTYASRCKADAAFALVAYTGECDAACASECAGSAWQPVCANETTFGSPCYAECTGAAFEDSDVGEPCARRECLCSGVWSPVCGADGKTYSNAACASCWEVPSLHAGPCMPMVQTTGVGGLVPRAACAAGTCATSASIEDPVCVVDGLPTGPAPLTFDNGCFATCRAGVPPGTPYYKGGCNVSCDDECAPVTMAGERRPGTYYSNPVCCPGAVEYPNKCYAQCVGGVKDPKTHCFRGPCRGKRAVKMLEELPCPPGSPSAMCAARPCDAAGACVPEGGHCGDNYCRRFFRLELLEELCAPVVIDKWGRLVNQSVC
eukprot:351017-Chlamydomonas_euryale.AAC.2